MDTDVIILGGGLVGATLALALAMHGLAACVVDPADPAVTLAPGFDGRASAVASASGRMLDAIGLGERLAGLGCPINAIRVSDGLRPGALDFTPDADDGALGATTEVHRWASSDEPALRSGGSGRSERSGLRRSQGHSSGRWRRSSGRSA